LPQADCPRVYEDHHHIKGDEEDGIKVIAEIKLHPRLADGGHATFVGIALNPAGLMGDDFEKPEGERKHNGGDGEANSY